MHSCAANANNPERWSLERIEIRASFGSMLSYRSCLHLNLFTQHCSHLSPLKAVHAPQMIYSALYLVFGALRLQKLNAGSRTGAK